MEIDKRKPDRLWGDWGYFSPELTPDPGKPDKRQRWFFLAVTLCWLGLFFYSFNYQQLNSRYIYLAHALFSRPVTALAFTPCICFWLVIGMWFADDLTGRGVSARTVRLLMWAFLVALASVTAPLNGWIAYIQ